MTGLASLSLELDHANVLGSRDAILEIDRDRFILDENVEVLERHPVADPSGDRARKERLDHRSRGLVDVLEHEPADAAAEFRQKEALGWIRQNQLDEFILYVLFEPGDLSRTPVVADAERKCQVQTVVR